MSDIRYILSIDTSMIGCGVCVLDTQSGVFATRNHNEAFGQAEHLIPLIQGCAQDAGVKLSELNLIAATIGPGSFTGLRTGITAAKSLALALDVPVFGLDTFLALKLSALKRNDFKGLVELASIIDTKRGDYYISAFNSEGEQVQEPVIMMPDEVIKFNCDHDVFWVGDYGDLELDGLKLTKPDSDVISIYAMENFDPAVEHTLQPLYLRDADIGVSKKVNRVLAK